MTNETINICYMYAKNLCITNEAKDIITDKIVSNDKLTDLGNIKLGNGLDNNFNKAMISLNNVRDISSLRESVEYLNKCGDSRCKILGEIIRGFIML